MGQKIGKASFEEDAKPFLNLPAPAINAVWTKFNLSAEAWGLRTAGFTNICKPLAPFMGVDEAIMDEKALALFKLLDTDMNDVVDALEFMATLSMVSAMEPADKVKFIYTVYDFTAPCSRRLRTRPTSIPSQIATRRVWATLLTPRTSKVPVVTPKPFISFLSTPNVEP